MTGPSDRSGRGEVIAGGDLDRPKLAASGPRVILKPVRAIRRDIDVGFAAGNEVGNDAAGRRGREGGPIIGLDAKHADGRTEQPSPVALLNQTWFRA